MATHLTRNIIGISMGLVLFAGASLAAEQAEVGKFVKARIDIGEMMMNYFKDGERYGEGERPSPEAMAEMGADINAKLTTLLAKYDMTVEEYRQRSPEVFSDDAAVKGYLSEHPDLKERYEALPFDRMGSGSSGRGY
ncbi:MAG: hypothetical protein ACQ9IQ_14140 [Nitrospirales bacterium]